MAIYTAVQFNAIHEWGPAIDELLTCTLTNTEYILHSNSIMNFCSFRFTHYTLALFFVSFVSIFFAAAAAVFTSLALSMLCGLSTYRHSYGRRAFKVFQTNTQTQLFHNRSCISVFVHVQQEYFAWYWNMVKAHFSYQTPFRTEYYMNSYLTEKDAGKSIEWKLEY